MAGLLREPALHFLLLGAGLFAVHRAVAPPPPEATIVVSAGYVAALRDDEQRARGRAPTAAEERARIDRYVDEELLLREALALGLDRGDSIVRRRLAQKMELLLRAQATLDPPTEEALAGHLRDHAAAYAEPARRSFRHVFLERRPRGDGAPEARGLLQQLDGGADPKPLGDPFLVGREFHARSQSEVAATFGDEFARALWTLEGVAWQGPIRSSYGLHLVQIFARSDAAAPSLATVRSRVAADLTAVKQEQALGAAMAGLRARYRVRVESAPPEPIAQPAPMRRP